MGGVDAAEHGNGAHVADVSRLDEAFQWNITRIADAFGLHRDTVRKRLREAGVVPAATRNGAPVYALKDVGPALFDESRKTYAPGVDPSELPPRERKDWYQSEQMRIALEREQRLLVPVEEAHREQARMAKQFVNTLDAMPDLVERDTGATPEQVELIQRICDELRVELYKRLTSDDDDDICAEA